MIVKQPSLLITDDDDGMRAILADFLASRGYAVAIARDGR